MGDNSSVSAVTERVEGLNVAPEPSRIECFTTTFLHAHSWLNWV